MRPEEIQNALDDYKRPIVEDRSVNDNLESTEVFVNWATKKFPQFDPENRRPIPVRSPICNVHVPIFNFIQ